MRIKFVHVECAKLTIPPNSSFKCEIPIGDHISNDSNVLKYRDHEDFIMQAGDLELAMFRKLAPYIGFANVTKQSQTLALFHCFFLGQYPQELHGYLRQFCEIQHHKQYTSYIHNKFVVDALYQTGLISDMDIFQAKLDAYEGYGYSDHIKKCIDHYCNTSNGRFGAYKLNH